jgi:hypothetical protein
MQRNPYLCLVIVSCIGLVAAIGMLGLIVESIVDHGASPAVVAIVSTCVGSLASFLVQVPGKSAGHPGEKEEKA